MKRTLKGSKPLKPNPDMLTQAAQNLDPAQLNQVQSTIDQYSGKSDAELMRELQTARQSGAIDPNELANVAQRIAPMLSPEQQQRLFAVMQQLQ